MHRFVLFWSAWILVFVTRCVMTRPQPNSVDYEQSYVLSYAVGNCLVDDYYQKVQACKSNFFQTVRYVRGITPNCSAKYTTLKHCVLSIYEKCMESKGFWLCLNTYHLKTIKKNLLTMLGDENVWCKQGGLAAPTELYEGVNCKPIYAHAVKDCISSYHNVFRAHVGNDRLCNSYREANTCLLDNHVKYCELDMKVNTIIPKMITADYNYHPFCNKPGKKVSYNQIMEKVESCSTFVHADVIFLVDVSNGTTDEEFFSMKETISMVAKKLTYRMNGIRISLAQYHEDIHISIKMDRYAKKSCFLGGLSHINRTEPKVNHQRLTGKAMKYLAENQLNIGEESSVVRPYHAPLCVVLTTGKSDDSVHLAVESLTSKGVHVVRIGPNFSDEKSPRNVTYHVKNTRNFQAKSDNITREICSAYQSYQTGPKPRDVFAFMTEEAMPLEGFSSLCANDNPVQVPNYWKLKPLEVSNFSLSSHSSNA